MFIITSLSNYKCKYVPFHINRSLQMLRIRSGQGSFSRNVPLHQSFVQTWRRATQRCNPRGAGAWRTSVDALNAAKPLNTCSSRHVRAEADNLSNMLSPPLNCTSSPFNLSRHSAHHPPTPIPPRRRRALSSARMAVKVARLPSP